MQKQKLKIQFFIFSSSFSSPLGDALNIERGEIDFDQPPFNHKK
jgi:hypothetical protein